MTLREEIKAIDDRVREATDSLNQDVGTLGQRLVNEFEGIWESLGLIASRIDEIDKRTPQAN